MVDHSYSKGVGKFALETKPVAFPCCGKDRGRNNNKPKFVFAALLIFFFSFFATSMVAQESSYVFEVPQQSADGALTALADQADISVVFDFEVVSQYQANQLEGVYSLPEALGLMLAGTDLKFEFGDSDHLVITKNTLTSESNTMGNSKNRSLLAAFVGLVVGAGGAQQVVAQDAGPVASRTFEEIIVTARKREESLADVPVAISAFSETGLQEAGIEDIDELLNATPGAVYTDTNGNRASANLGIRGIRGGVSTFIDGMPMTGSQASINFVDVQSAEIYRGPQSAVFGRSVFAGAINYTTRTPSLTGIEGGLNSEYGSDSHTAVNGWVSAPIIEDVLAISLSAARDSYGGPNEIKSTDGYDMGIRDTEYYSVALAFEPTDQLSANLRYTATHLDDGPAADYNMDPADNPSQYVEAAANYDDMGARIPTANFAPMFFGEINIADSPVLDRNFCYNPGLADQNCILDPGWELDRTRLAFDIDYEFLNGHNLAFKTFTTDEVTFDHDDQDNTSEAVVAMSIVNMGTDVNIDEDYFEILWTSPGEERLRYTLGYSDYSYFRESAAYFIHPAATLTPAGATAPGISTEDVKNSGIFGGVFYDLTDQLTVSFEARQQKDEITARDPDPTDTNVPEAITDTFLPRLSLQYAFADNLNFYAQYSEGAKPATINTEAVNTTQRAVAAGLDGLVVDGVTLSSAIPFLDSVLAVDEEGLKNYEIGMKGQFLDNTLAIEAALFLIKTDSYAQLGNLWFTPTGVDTDRVFEELALQNPGVALLQDPLADTSFRVRGSVNTGDLKSTGLEVAASYLLDDNWTLSGQLTYLDTVFENGCDFGGATFGLTDSTLSLAGGDPIACTEVSGNRFTYVPEIQLGASATYEAPLDNGMDWFARLDVRYEDEQFVDTYNNAWLPSSLKLNLRAGINMDNIRLEAYVQNLTDDDTPAGAQYEPDRKEVANYFGTRPPAGSTGINVAIATPREVGLRVSLDF